MRQYLQVLWRTLCREKLYTVINIAGLSLGVACFLILALFLRGEWTYDYHNVKRDRIYRVVNEFRNASDAHGSWATTPHVLAHLLAADNPQIEAYVRFDTNPYGELTGSQAHGYAIRHGTDTYYWRDVYLVDDNVFEVFTHEILAGDPKTALKDDLSVAVSETFARKYFNRIDVVGEAIYMELVGLKRITLVFADLPANSHLKYDVLLSSNPQYQDDDPRRLWGVGSYTYLLMAPGFDPTSWSDISERFFKRYMQDAAGGRTWHSWLQPLTATHWDGGLDNDVPNGNPLFLYGYAAVALFILAVACINYMNLATARATRRARSVGIRKVLGASRLSLGLQFLSEAILFALLAVMLAIVIVEVVLHARPLNSLMEQQVRFDLRSHPALIGWLLGFGVVIGTLSGLYPALYLSAWAPLVALTGRHNSGERGRRLREALVLVQFTISGAMIAATLLMAWQMRFIGEKSLGFIKENRVLVSLHGIETIDKIPAMRAQLRRDRRILGAAEMDHKLVPGEVLDLQEVPDIDNEVGVPGGAQLFIAGIGEGFTGVMGLKIVAGRDLSREDFFQLSQRLLPGSAPNCLVNESLVRRMGWREPIGKQIGTKHVLGRVVGVVSDFNFKSLHTRVEPLVLYPAYHFWDDLPQFLRPFVARTLVVSISGEDVVGALSYIKRVVSDADPRYPFDYTFLDDSLNRLYASEQRMLQLIGIFAVLCVFIACLGLFGLAAFTTAQRTREIGTRKVLGASRWQIIRVLSSRIMYLVAVAAVLAGVIAFLAMDEWLSGFSYRAPMSPLIFVLAAVMIGAVAFGTVTLQAMRTASEDPALALREK
ncbi:MAG: FtsX-like permease family protein [Steroidobacteraceae bacterium]